MPAGVPWLPFYFRKNKPECREHLQGWVWGSSRPSSLDRVIGSVTVPLTSCARSHFSNQSKRSLWHSRNDLAAVETCTISAFVLHLWCICGLDLLQASASGCKWRKILLGPPVACFVPCTCLQYLGMSSLKYIIFTYNYVYIYMYIYIYVYIYIHAYGHGFMYAYIPEVTFGSMCNSEMHWLIHGIETHWLIHGIPLQVICKTKCWMAKHIAEPLSCHKLVYLRLRCTPLTWAPCRIVF